MCARPTLFTNKHHHNARSSYLERPEPCLGECWQQQQLPVAPGSPNSNDVMSRLQESPGTAAQRISYKMVKHLNASSGFYGSKSRICSHRFQLLFMCTVPHISSLSCLFMFTATCSAKSKSSMATTRESISG